MFSSFTSFVYCHRLWPWHNNNCARPPSYAQWRRVKNNNTIWPKKKKKIPAFFPYLYCWKMTKTHNAYALDDNSSTQTLCLDDIQYPILHNNCPNYTSNMANHSKCSYQHFENGIMNYEKNGKMILFFHFVDFEWWWIYQQNDNNHDVMENITFIQINDCMTASDGISMQGDALGP